MAALFSSGPALAQTPTVDYDLDDDGLIEVSNLAQLNAVRWDLDGNGRSSNDVAFVPAYPNRGANDDGAPTMGCPNHTCTGYELTADLDFDTNRNGVTDSGDAYWNDGAGWEPIRVWTATFDGGYHTISNLFIDRSGNEGGLFGRTEAGAEIRNVGLLDVDITMRGNAVGALVGSMNGNGEIAKVYATGAIDTDRGGTVNQDRLHTGGLVGWLDGTVQASWADVDVRGCKNSGGLVGRLESGAVQTSYSVGNVLSRGSRDSNGRQRGYCVEANGLVGDKGTNAGINFSYYDSSITLNKHGDIFPFAQANKRTTAQLQNPMGYTDLYSAWNLDLDNADADSNLLTGGDDPWDFGTASQYPALKGDRNNDGVFTWEEFGHQGRVDLPDVIVMSAQAAVTEGQTVRFTVTIDAAPAQPLTIDVRVQAKGDYGVANAEATVTIPANRKSVAYTVNTVGDTTNERHGWVQLSALTGDGYDLPIPSSRVNVNDNDLPASVAGVYTPRLPQASGSLDSATTRTSQNVPRPGTFCEVRPDNSSKARQDAREFGETQEYQDYQASLKYKWEQISGPPLGPPLKGGCEKNLPGHPWGHSTYCTYSLYSPEQVMSWNVWDGVTRPSALYAYRINGATPPGDYVFRLIVRDQFKDDTYTAPQTITVTVADETGGASAPRAVGRVSTRSLHPQASYTVNEVGKGPDGVYGGGDDTIVRISDGPDGIRDTADDVHEHMGDPGPDEIIGTDDDYILIVGPDGLPCTDDDTLACGPDKTAGTDDELNLGPDNRAGTDDDNTYEVDPPGNALQSPDRSVTLSGSSSRAASGRSIRSYSWQQICMNPDADGDHKLIALDLLLRGQGYCGVDVELSRFSGSTTTFTTPVLPATVRRVALDNMGNKVETTTTEENNVRLYFMLTVTDSAGNRDYDIVKVEVEPLPQWVVDGIRDDSPIPSAKATYTGSIDGKPALEGATVTLDGTGSRATRGSIASYRWRQISGPTVELTDADQRRATFTTPTGQTRDLAYSFLLTVTNTVGWSDSAVVRLGVRARPTVEVEFTTPNAQTKTDWEAGEVIGLRGDIGGIAGETLTYGWLHTSVPTTLAVAWTEDIIGTLEGSSGRVTNGFTLPCLSDETLYTFALGVSDDVSDPTGIGKRVIRVNANPDGCPSGATGQSGEPLLPEFQLETAAPTADAGPDLNGKRGEQDIALAGSGTAHADGSPELSYQWRIAAASHSELVSLTGFLNDADQAPARFTMPRRRDVNDRSALDDGNWIDFELTVTDGDGESASDTMRLTIQGTTWTANTPPTVAELAAARVFTGETASLTGQATDAEDAACADLPLGADGRNAGGVHRRRQLGHGQFHRASGQYHCGPDLPAERNRLRRPHRQPGSDRNRPADAHGLRRGRSDVRGGGEHHPGGHLQHQPLRRMVADGAPVDAARRPQRNADASPNIPAGQQVRRPQAHAAGGRGGRRDAGVPTDGD